MQKVAKRLELREFVEHRINKAFRKLYGDARFQGLKILGFLIIENAEYESAGGRISKRYKCLRSSVCKEDGIDNLSASLLDDPTLMELSSDKDFLYCVGRDVEENEEDE